MTYLGHIVMIISVVSVHVYIHIIYMGLSHSLEGFGIVAKVAGSLPRPCGWGKVASPWEIKQLLKS